VSPSERPAPPEQQLLAAGKVDFFSYSYYMSNT